MNRPALHNKIFSESMRTKKVIDVNQFCPTCGNNAHQLKFCPACGTNLEAISHALSGSTDGVLVKADKALDKLIARYAERIIKNAPAKLLERHVSKSWQLLGQGVITSAVDFILLMVMWVVLPVRLLTLLVRTPISLLAERSKRQKSGMAAVAEPSRERWLAESGVSVTEQTTIQFGASGSTARDVEAKRSTTR